MIRTPTFRTLALGTVLLPLATGLALSGCSFKPGRDQAATDEATRSTPRQAPASAALASNAMDSSAVTSSAVANAADAATGLRLIVEPFPYFYFLVRAQAAGVLEASPELQPIIDAWMPVQNEIGTFGGFWRFDLAGLESGSPSEFGDWFTELPETVASRAGGTIPIRGPGLAMAEAMKTSWPRFQNQRWPELRAELDVVVARLEREFMPRHREALRYMLESLGITDPEIEVPTHLVLETHPPGASTYRTSRGPIAVLSTRDLLSEGRFSDLEETLLHETCHALDVGSQGEDDAFTVLRRMLLERGVGERDRRLHDIPHLVMFAQAENTMRRLYDPKHIAYGDTWRGDIAPLYERSGEAANVVRNAWSDYLDGKLSRHEALTRIVQDLVQE